MQRSGAMRGIPHKWAKRTYPALEFWHACRPGMTTATGSVYQAYVDSLHSSAVYGIPLYCTARRIKTGGFASFTYCSRFRQF